MPVVSKPHVVLITCHDLGRRLGCYGLASDPSPSPHLDGLASEGARFAQAFCTAPQCSPSRASLATGRYPHANGVMGLAHGRFGWELHDDERHLARLLGEEGYETHLFGVQHVSAHVERLGFARVHERRLAGAVAEDVSDLLRATRPRRPLYLEVNIEQPHRPYDQGGATPEAVEAASCPPWLPESTETLAELAALRGAIHTADGGVGGVLGALEEAGLADDAFVIFTSDHGLAMPRAKCTLYDPGIQIALLMRWPERIAAGSVVDGLVSNIDVVPTVLDGIGTAVPERVNGRSLWPLIEGQVTEGRQMVFAEKTFHSYYDPMRAVRTDRFKLIRNFESSPVVEVPADVQMGKIFRSAVERYSVGERPDLELYDLDGDPIEQYDLAGDPAFAETCRELDECLWNWMRATGDPLLDGPVASPAYRRAISAMPPAARGRD